jgi:hypothetical protein
MNRPPVGVMFVYALTEPVDDFDALTPLPDWITADPVPHPLGLASRPRPRRRR